MENFTQKYALSKTLRFELKPVGETAEHIKDFKNKALAEIVKQDKERAEDYKQMKKIVDDYHRHFIEEVLSKEILTRQDIQEAFDSYIAFKGSKNENKKKQYQSIQKTFRKKISDAFGKKQKDYTLFSANLINTIKKQKPVLWQWLKDNNKDTHKLKELIKRFDGWFTYFSGFNENRKNMYKGEEQSTAISYRIINDNMVKHFNNCLNFEKIQQNSKYKDLAEQLKNYSNIFEPTAFSSFLNQTGIDDYNEKIGRKSDDKHTEGVNQLISKYRQEYNKGKKKEEKIKGKDLPIMEKLYKQILSKTENVFKIDVFKDPKEMSDEIIRFYNKLFVEGDILQKFKNHLKQYFIEENSDDIYINGNESLNRILIRLYDGWGSIPEKLKTYTGQDEGDDTKKKKTYSVKEIQTIIDEDLKEQREAALEEKKIGGSTGKTDLEEKNIFDYFLSFKCRYEVKKDKYGEIEISERIKQTYSDIKPFLDSQTKNSGLKNKDKKKIQRFMDTLNSTVHFVKPLYMRKKGKWLLNSVDCNVDFYEEFNDLYQKLTSVSKLYDKTRNYVTQKSYKLDKFKINFKSGHFLSGWATDYEKNGALLFIKDNKYYLCIVNSILTKNEQKKLTNNDTKDAVRIVYDFQKPDNKNTPRLFIRSKGDRFAPAVSKYNLPIKKIIDIYDSRKFTTDYKKKNPVVFKKSLELLIDYFKEGFQKHDSYKHYKFNWKPTKEYNDISEFYHDTRVSCYALHKEKINFEILLNYAKKGKIYLFEIYSKDFPNENKPFPSKGNPNLHTSYFKLLFAKENLDNIVLKLNGEAEIFFREASPINKKVHKEGDVLKHKRHSKIWQELKSPITKPITEKDLLAVSRDIKVVDAQIGKTKVKNVVYDGKIIGKIASHPIIKDRRFTQDKFFFHCPITLNFKESKVPSRKDQKSAFCYKFNENVNQELKDNSKVNIIGIDRGERHLLYYSIIDQSENIIKDKEGNYLQGSFNTVKSSYKSNGKDIPVKTDYHDLLNTREKKRDEERKSWSTIENIKELKGGYLSHIVHKISQLMIRYNAIVVLEDLNSGFKRGRFKVEKQVYQKFEKALINKLNYLVFKDRQSSEKGHYLNAYQLTAPFESFDELDKKKQSGVLFYISPSYTSITDPVTGFVHVKKRLNTTLKKLEESHKFFEKFNSIHFNDEKDYFEFVFCYKNFAENPDEEVDKWQTKPWTVCTTNKERYRYDRKKGETVPYNVTEKLKVLFKKYGIDYEDGEDLRDRIAKCQEVKFFNGKKDGEEKGRGLLFYLGLTLQLRHQFESEDFILSPVADGNGNFFDSRKAEENQPKDADANGAYNIARKGLMVLEQIKRGDKPSPIKNADWFDFAQKANN